MTRLPTNTFYKELFWERKGKGKWLEYKRKRLGRKGVPEISKLWHGFYTKD
jgi:hypothetical protein